MNIELTGSVPGALFIFCVLLVPSIACGVTLTQYLKNTLYLGERILLGSILGLTLFTAISFAVTFVVEFQMPVLVGILLLFAGTCVVLFKNFLSVDKPFKTTCLAKIDIWGLVVFSISMIVFTLIMNRLIVWQDGSFSTFYIDAWGDLPWHTSLIMSFVNQVDLQLQNTIAAGHPLIYPFMSDYFSAILIRFGIPLEYAIEWPAILLNSMTLTLLYYLSYRLVKNRAAALLTPVLFMLAGGLGFLWFLRDAYFASEPIWEFIKHLSARYTNLPDLKIHWVNPTLAYLIPQRSFLFGLPIGLSVILLWWQAFKRKRPKDAWLSGIFVGLLPFFHTHTLLALSFAALGLFALSQFHQDSRRAHFRYWLIVGGIAIGIALPQIGYLLSKVSLKTIRFHPGWMAESENVIWFWLKNLGLFIPLLLTTFFFKKRLKLSKHAVQFYLPFAFIFIITNLFLFAPFAYDNNKIILYWFLLSLPFVSHLLVTFYNSRSWWLSKFTFRFVFVTLIFSGGLNLLHEFQSGGWVELSAEEVELSKDILKRIEPSSTFLTAPVQNNILSLTGHPVVLGYPGHVFSHGMDYIPIERAVNAMFRGGADAAKEFQNFGVDYVVVGPHERSKFGESVDRFESNYLKVFQTKNYIVYDINSKPLIETNEIKNHTFELAKK